MQALPQNRVRWPWKNKHDYPENPKKGIEITRRAVDLPGFVQRRTKLWEEAKNKVRVLPGRMYRLVRSDRSVYRDAENALKTCFIEKTKEQQAAREEGELCRFVRMAPDGGVELISNAGNVVRFKNAEDLAKMLRFAKDVLRVTEALKNGNQN